MNIHISPLIFLLIKKMCEREGERASGERKRERDRGGGREKERLSAWVRDGRLPDERERQRERYRDRERQGEEA